MSLEQITLMNLQSFEVFLKHAIATNNKEMEERIRGSIVVLKTKLAEYRKVCLSH